MKTSQLIEKQSDTFSTRHCHTSHMTHMGPSSTYAANPVTDFDEDKVARIIQAIEAGIFQINAKAIADKLIQKLTK